MNSRLFRAVIIAALSAAPIAANALPSFASVTSGSALFFTSGDTLTIETIGDTAITWSSFSIGAGETVYFLQSDSQYEVLNTVSGGPAQIYGNLGSNGAITLDAPAGIYVGMSGRINAPSLSLFSEPGVIIIEDAISLNSTNFDLTGNLVSIGGTLGNSGPINPGGGGLINPGGGLINPGGGLIISAIPEPETYAMLLAGLGLLGLAARRRKQKPNS